MASEEHIEIANKGIKVWNKWRTNNPSTKPNLSNVTIGRVDFSGFDLSHTEFSGTFFLQTNLRNANLKHASLMDAVIEQVQLNNADLSWTNISNANISSSEIEGANFEHSQLFCTLFFACSLKKSNMSYAGLNATVFNSCDLIEANLHHSMLGNTAFCNSNLSRANHLESCSHHGPSTVDHSTLLNSDSLSVEFLKGCGVPEILITNYPKLINQYHSCFISYSHKDEQFVKKLHADLQNKGVRCWFAPEDMKIGDKIRSRLMRL